MGKTVPIWLYKYRIWNTVTSLNPSSNNVVESEDQQIISPSGSQPNIASENCGSEGATMGKGKSDLMIIELQRT